MKTLIKTITAVAALSAALSTSAMAQDADQWQGFYAGANVNLQNLGVSGLPFGADPELGFGLYGGYNHAVAPNFVLGGELGWDSGRTYNFNGAPLKLDQSFSLRARGGYAFGNSLLYGTLGYARTDYNAFAFGSGSGDGVVYGVGLETKLSDAISTRFEYTRTTYDFSGPATALGGRTGDVDKFSIGMSYQF